MIRLGLDISAVRPGATGVGYVAYALWQTLRQQPDLDVVPLTPSIAHHTVRVPTRIAWMQLELPSIMRSAGVRIAHFPNYLAPLRCPVPFVVHFHDLSVFRYPDMQPLKKRWLFRSLLHQVARSAACIVTVSHAMVREIVDYFQVPEDRVVPVWNGRDPAFRPTTQNEQDLVLRRYGIDFPFFLTVGAVQPRKNLETLLDVMAYLRDRGGPYHLVVIGPRGWQYHKVFDRWRRLHLRDRVHFLGYVPRQDLVQLYNAAIALAYPSIYEGFGLPLLEAMACGTPIVASDVPALREVAGVAALWVAPLDVDAWVESLHRIAEDETLRQTLRTAGLVRAQLFSWERTARALVDVYRQILNTMETPLPAHLGNDGVDLKRLRTAVRRGLLYFRLFKHPVTLEELHRSLPEVSVSMSRLKRFLDGIAERAPITCAQGYYAWCESEASLSRWIERRRRREEHCERLLQRYNRFVRRIARLPFVRMVGASGGVMFGVDVTDVDLFIITQKDRVALVYWMIVVLSRLWGVRSVLCANYLLDETALALPERDFYTAHQVIHLKILAGYSMYLAFWEANPWVRAVFPNAHPYPPDMDQPDRCGQWFIERCAAWLGARFWNRLGLWLIRRHLRSKIRPDSSVRLTPHVLKLHLRDYRTRILRRFEDIQRQVPAISACYEIGSSDQGD